MNYKKTIYALSFLIWTKGLQDVGVTLFRKELWDMFHDSIHKLPIFHISLRQIITNISTAIVVDKMYPRYNPEGNLDKDEIQQINHKIRDLFTSKIGFVVVDSADTIVISAFLGLTALAIYQNYFYILSSVMGFIAVVFTSCTAGIGNSIIVETAEKNYNDLKKFTFLISWISGMCLCCFLNLYQPFMELWVGKDLMLSMGAVVCFCVYFYIQEINKLFNTYKDASGIWHEDRFRPLVVALTNLCLNLLMVNFWGIYGILLSTVFATLFVGIVSLNTEIASITANIDTLKADLKEKKSALKRTEKEVASLEAKKAKADAKAAEEAKKAEAESVVKKLLASGMSADEILEKLK